MSMVEPPDVKKIFRQQLREAAQAMNTERYARALSEMDLANEYKHGNQISREMKAQANFPVLAMAAVDADLQTLAGTTAAGATKVTIQPHNDLTATLLNHSMATFESWQFHEDFEAKIPFAAYKMFDAGCSAIRLPVDSLERMPNGLPRIKIEIPDSRQIVMDPKGTNPHDSLCGGRWGIVWDVVTMEQLEEEYEDGPFHGNFMKAKRLSKEDADGDGFTYSVTDVALQPNPVQHIFRLVEENSLGGYEAEFGDRGEKIGPEHAMARMDIVRKIVITRIDRGQRRKERAYLRMRVITRLIKGVPDKNFANAILVDVRVIDYHGNSPIIFMCADPPYGQPMVKIVSGEINARNFAMSAAMGMIATIVRSGRKFAVLKDVWDQDQMAKYEQAEQEPDVFMFSAKKFQEAGIHPADVRTAIQSLQQQFPQVSQLLEFSAVLENNQAKKTATPYAAQGEATPSTRISADSLGILQQGAASTKSIVAEIVQLAATNVARCAWGMMRRHWIADHRIIRNGVTPFAMNQIIQDHAVADRVLQGDIEIEGNPLTLNAVRAIVQDEDGQQLHTETWPLEDGLKSVWDDPVLEWLGSRDDVVHIVWVANALEALSGDVDIAIDADADLRDSENYQKYQFIMQYDPAMLAERVRFDLSTGSSFPYTYDENLRMKLEEQGLERLLQLAPEQIDAILAQVEQGAGGSGQVPLNQSNAAQIAAPQQ